MKVALGDAALLNCYFLFERSRESHDNLHLDLAFCGQWVYQKGSGVHGHIESFCPDFALLADGNRGNDSADRDFIPGDSPAVADGDSSRSSCWQLRAPFGFLCNRTQYLEPGPCLRKIRI